MDLVLLPRLVMVNLAQVGVTFFGINTFAHRLRIYNYLDRCLFFFLIISKVKFHLTIFEFLWDFVFVFVFVTRK